MLMWYIILIVTAVLTAISILYVSNCVGRFAWIQKISYYGSEYSFKAGGLIVFVIFGILCLTINITNAVVCLIYFALFWFICDILFGIVQKIRQKSFRYYYAGFLAIILGTTSLIYGWYNNHHIEQTNYTIQTDKITEPLKIAFFADSHIGTTFNGEGFSHHLKRITSIKPDVLFIVGDYVDDDTQLADMLYANYALKQLKLPYGVYYVLGNHDKGYHRAERRGYDGAKLIHELTQSGVIVLQDEFDTLLDSIYVVGRKDSSENLRGGSRLSQSELIENLDKNKFIIVLDHQPNDYTNQVVSGVDLVLSGHTHGGQLWPFSKVGEWIGANDKTYGYEKRENTNFIVTSGLSDWAIKFKTGTKSEFVIIDIVPNQKMAN